MAAPTRCPACQAPLPSTARPTQRFCATRCRKRAQARRGRGLPEADPGSLTSAPDVAAALRKRDRQLAGKERVIARLRTSRQIARDRARAAEVEAAAESRRAEDAIAATHSEQARLREHNAELLQRVTQAQQELRKAAGDAGEVAGLRQTVAELSAVTELPREVRRQWEALAARIARQAATSNVPIAGLDHEVMTTWQRHRKQAPATQPAPARRQRPAARPAARPATRPAATPPSPERPQP